MFTVEFRKPWVWKLGHYSLFPLYEKVILTLRNLQIWSLMLKTLWYLSTPQWHFAYCYVHALLWVKQCSKQALCITFCTQFHSLYSSIPFLHIKHKILLHLLLYVMDITDTSRLKRLIIHNYSVFKLQFLKILDNFNGC